MRVVGAMAAAAKRAKDKVEAEHAIRVIEGGEEVEVENVEEEEEEGEGDKEELQREIETVSDNNAP